MPEKTWNTDDIDFDREGRLVIKNPQLAEIVKQSILERNELAVLVSPSPQPIVNPPPPPNSMCGCMRLQRIIPEINS